MPTKPPTSSFSSALRTARMARGVAQEEFDLVSSRTYVSALERGLKQPTLAKVDELASVLRLHPLTLLALSYGKQTQSELNATLSRVSRELDELLSSERSMNRPSPKRSRTK